MTPRFACTAAMLLLASVACGAAPVRADQIGTTTAVNPASTARAPSGAVRTLVIGNQVVRDERVRTTDNGSVQLLFIDRTTMSIGPNSDVTLDEYVFNPATGTGHMAVRFGKGLMRFVGGEVTHTGEADITTPAGVLGIRGGLVLLDDAGANAAALRITVAYGRAILRAIGGAVTILPGYTAVLGPGGHVELRPTTSADMGRLNHSFDHGAGHGSVHLTGTYLNTVLGPGAPSNVGFQPPAPAPGNQQQTPPPPVSASDLQTTTVTAGTQQSVPTEPTPPTGTGGVFALSMTNCCDPKNETSPVPYFPLSSPTPPVISPVYGFAPAVKGTLFPAGVFQTGLGISGDGAAQTSIFDVMAGSFSNGKFTGDFLATARFAASDTVAPAEGSFTSTGTVAFDSAGVPKSGTVTSTSASFTDPSLATAPTSPSAATSSTSTAPPPQSYSFVQDFTRLATSATLGTVRPDVTLQGFAGGIMETFDTSTGTTSPAFAVTSGDQPGGFTLAAEKTLGILTAGANVVTASPTGSSDFSEGLYVFGSIDGGTSTHPTYVMHGVYVDGDHFGAVEARSNGASLSTVNGKAIDKSSRLALASSGSVDLSHFSNVTLCKCEYTKWGFWSVQDARTDSTGNFIDRGHLMEWVAGQLPAARDIPTTGTASYTGHVVASIQNGNAAYVAAGKFKSTVNFASSPTSATGMGTVRVKNLDGYNYSGHIYINSNRGTFTSSAPISSTLASTGRGANLGMMVNGAFYGTHLKPVQEMGGSVLIKGTTTSGVYLGSGIFAGRK